MENFHNRLSADDEGTAQDPTYLEWMIRRYPEQFRNISAARLRPDLYPKDRLLSECVAMRDKLRAHIDSEQTGPRGERR